MTIRNICIITPILLLIFGQILAQRLTKPQVDDNTKFTSTGNIGLTISNYGTFGDGFAQQSPVDQPSCEYPRGSGIEHIFGGGLWIGAETVEGIKVTTGAFNAARFQTGGSINFEFTNTADPNDVTVERSSLADNKFFSPEAISHQDFIAQFSDTNRVVPGTTIPIPNHDPMGIAVELQSYAWNFPFADAFTILNYSIKNVSPDTLRDIYVGLWADLVVRNVNITPPRVGAPFYQHVGVGYIDNDSTRLVYAYDYDGDPGFTDSYVALAHLGADTQPGDQTYGGNVTHNWWLFGGGIEDYEIAPGVEEQRYERMRESFSDQVFNNEIYESPGNWMSLVSTGPFESIDPGSSINVVFAVVCARKFGFRPATIDDEDAKKNLVENVAWALRAYYGEDTNRNGILDFAGSDSTEDVNGNGQLDRYVLPTPPRAPRMKAILDDRRVTLRWDKSAEQSIDLISKKKDFEGYRVYRSFLGDDRVLGGTIDNMELVGEYDFRNGLFYDTGLEAILMSEPIVETETDPETGEQVTTEYFYELEIDGLHNGWEYAFAITAFDSGDAGLRLPSLESSKLTNVVVISPGTPARSASQQTEVGVYPNPYRVNALWDGTRERDRKLYFNNLPARCDIRIYTLAGDVIDSFRHDGFSSTGTAGGEHAWDVISEFDQAIATGLYLFTVKDLDSDKIYKGKFVIIK